MKFAVTDATGSYKVGIPDKPGTYRGFVEGAEVANPPVTCGEATSEVKRHTP